MCFKPLRIFDIHWTRHLDTNILQEVLEFAASKFLSSKPILAILSDQS